MTPSKCFRFVIRLLVKVCVSEERIVFSLIRKLIAVNVSTDDEKACSTANVSTYEKRGYYLMSTEVVRIVLIDFNNKIERMAYLDTIVSLNINRFLQYLKNSVPAIIDIFIFSDIHKN